jgi:FkbM family methyltransferase
MDTKKNYSQLDQDLWILSKFDTDYKGFYIEIGANDGVALSNSLLLEENGWEGVCIEPAPTEFEKLNNNRKSNNHNICISDFNGKCHFSENGFFGKISDKNTGNTDCFTLEYFLDNIDSPKVIDYLSIDVEGGEYDIIRNFPFDKYFVKYITIEHNAYGINFTLKNNINSILSEHFNLEQENVGEFEDWYSNKLL